MNGDLLMEFHIRDAKETDVPAITKIYGYHVLHGTGSFETEPPDEAEIDRRRLDVVSRGLPYFVAEDGAKIIGYAYAGRYRTRVAYRFTLEDSVYIDPEHMGRGI